MLLNRDKSKDPDGLTPLHIAYLLRNQKEFTTFDENRVKYNGESILDSLLNIPELVELDGLQRDKFQSNITTSSYTITWLFFLKNNK